MKQGIKISWDVSLFFLRREHSCLNCQNILERKRREVVVNSRSREAKNYDFSNGTTFMCGDVKFVTFFFECPNCGKTYEPKELKKLEKERKRQIRREKREQKKKT